MSTQALNDSEAIKKEFQKLFEKTPEEQIEHRAQMLSFIFLSEAEKAMDRKGWTKKRLAKEIGTSASYLTQLFRGDRLLNFKNVAKIEQALSLNYEISEESNRTEEFKPYIDFFIDSVDMENDPPVSRPDYESEQYESVSGCKIYDLRAA